MRIELSRKHRGVGLFKVVGGLLHFVLMKHVPIRDRTERTVGPNDIEDAFLVLNVHPQALEAVGDLAHHGPAVEAPHLLEVGELRDFHAVQPHLPAQSPCTQGGRLPVVFDKTDVMRQQVEPDGAQGIQVQFLKVIRRGLDADLELIVMLQAKRVIAVASVSGTARRLHVGRAPGFRAHRAQERCRVERAGAHFHIVGLQDNAALPGPIFLQRKNEILKGAGWLGESGGHRMLGSKAREYSYAGCMCPWSLNAEYSTPCTLFAHERSIFRSRWCSSTRITRNAPYKGATF